MPDMLGQGSAWLEDQRHKHLSRSVVYQRGEESIELAATIGRTEFEQVDQSGMVNKIESRDFLVRRSDLILGGAPSLPKPGDRIRETSDEQIFIYEVMSPLGGNEPPFRYSDPNRHTLRIHTKHVGTEAVTP
jgi:hypothetical protein